MLHIAGVSGFTGWCGLFALNNYDNWDALIGFRAVLLLDGEMRLFQGNAGKTLWNKIVKSLKTK